MAQKKGVGSSRNGRDSNPKYLGVKKSATGTPFTGYHTVWHGSQTSSRYRTRCDRSSG